MIYQSELFQMIVWTKHLSAENKSLFFEVYAQNELPFLMIIRWDRIAFCFVSRTPLFVSRTAPD